MHCRQCCCKMSAYQWRFYAGGWGNRALAPNSRICTPPAKRRLFRGSKRKNVPYNAGKMQENVRKIQLWLLTGRFQLLPLWMTTRWCWVKSPLHINKCLSVVILSTAASFKEREKTLYCIAGCTYHWLLGMAPVPNSRHLIPQHADTVLGLRRQCRALAPCKDGAADFGAAKFCFYYFFHHIFKSFELISRFKSA